MNEEKIIIQDVKRFNEIKNSFIKDGLNNIHIIADFDGTLTKTNVPGREHSSIISLLRAKEHNYLGNDYIEKANILFSKYHPIEVDSNLDIDFKKQKMDEWWKAHFELLISSHLKFEHIEKVALSGILELKDKCKELLDFSRENNIPFVILSANGIGDATSIFLNHNNCLYDNIHFITNHFKYDDMGFATEYFNPVITSLNKDENIINNFPEIFEKVKDRKNVILIGDGMGDVKMAEGFEYNNIIKIGFLNEKQDENLEYYKNNYDVVLIENNSIEFVNKFLEDIK